MSSLDATRIAEPENMDTNSTRNLHVLPAFVCRNVNTLHICLLDLRKTCASQIYAFQ